MNIEEATIKALQGKLTEDEIEGQINFDDLQREAELKNKFIYETKFNLVSPVNDFDAASAYLTEENMVEYFDASFSNDIASIEWILEDENSGVIKVTAKRELTSEELNELSDWIGGQNSDGLGEGFEQQDFAESYFNPEDGDGPYTRYDAENEISDLWDRIDLEDLIDNGDLNIADAVDMYREDNDDQDTDWDEIADIIRSDPEDYFTDEEIDDAKYSYTQHDPLYNIDDWYVMASFDWNTNKYKLHRVS